MEYQIAEYNQRAVEEARLRQERAKLEREQVALAAKQREQAERESWLQTATDRVADLVDSDDPAAALREAYRRGFSDGRRAQ